MARGLPTSALRRSAAAQVCTEPGLMLAGPVRSALLCLPLVPAMGENPSRAASKDRRVRKPGRHAVARSDSHPQ